MHAVLEHIDRHLHEKLDLARLASVASFSPFHFHRLFQALLGESLGDYLRRRRLEVAAGRLRAQARVSVLDIALGVGFGSAEAFTRAFRVRFGCSPTEWRNSKLDQAMRKPDQAAPPTPVEDLVSRHEETAVNVKIIDRQDTPVAYLRHTGPYGPGIGQFWRRNVAPWMEANNLMGRARYGIGLDDPTITLPEQCRYDACVESTPDEILAGDPGHKVIPGGKYATLDFQGPGPKLAAAWDALLRDWLPTSGLQLDARPFFEHYPTSGFYDRSTGSFSCTICVPVAPL